MCTAELQSITLCEVLYLRFKGTYGALFESEGDVKLTGNPRQLDL